MQPPRRRDDLDPLPHQAEWPSLRSAFGRVDIHSLAAFWVRETRVSGAYLEFGVGAGRSAVAALRANLRDNPATVGPFVLFDSFQGLPPLQAKDVGSAQFKAGDFAYSQEQVQAFLSRHGIPESAPVRFVPGWFEESLRAFRAADHQISRAAIVHIDVDLHASCRVVLEFVTPLLQEGTVILMDDWNAFAASDQRGERAATREWLLQHPEIRLHDYARYGWHGQAFTVERIA